jgi:hypothetical protein
MQAQTSCILLVSYAVTLFNVVIATMRFLGLKNFALVSDNHYQTIVFSSSPDPLEPKVSGVGLNHDPDGAFYIVPFIYDARWDDEGYQFPEIISGDPFEIVVP